MINTLSQLTEYTKQIAIQFPNEAKGIVLNPPGIGIHDRSALHKAIPELPDSYLQCAERFGLKGIRFGYFALWPEAFKGQTLAESLIGAYSERNPFFGQLKSSGLVQIASWEADPLVIACKKSTFAEGTILKYNVGNPKAQPTELASSFEMFLLFVGNMKEVASLYEGNKAIAEFANRMQALGASARMEQSWKTISDVVFLN